MYANSSPDPFLASPSHGNCNRRPSPFRLPPPVCQGHRRGASRTRADHLPEGVGTPRLAIHFLAVVRIRPFRRKAQGTFVVSVVEVEAEPADLLKAAYPIWLSNLLIYLVNRPDGLKTYFVTLEQGYYQTPLMGQAMRTISGPSTSGCAPWQPLSW